MHFREQCFAAAMEICSESEAAEVVHGWVPGGPGYVVHAWAEVEDAVYDLTESDQDIVIERLIREVREERAKGGAQ